MCAMKFCNELQKGAMNFILTFIEKIAGYFFSTRLSLGSKWSSLQNYHHHPVLIAKISLDPLTPVFVNFIAYPTEGASKILHKLHTEIIVMRISLQFGNICKKNLNLMKKRISLQIRWIRWLKLQNFQFLQKCIIFITQNVQWDL